MKCSKCGAELEEGALFCGSCGAKVEQNAAETTSQSIEVTESVKMEEVQPEIDKTENAQPAQTDPAPVAPVAPVAPAQPVMPVRPAAPAPQANPASQFNQDDDEGAPVSLGVWVCRHLINFIPCVGSIIYFIMLFVWSFDKKYNSTSRNWARAELIFMAVGILIGLLIVVGIVTVISINGYSDIVEDSFEHFGPGGGYYQQYGF